MWWRRKIKLIKKQVEADGMKRIVTKKVQLQSAGDEPPAGCPLGKVGTVKQVIASGEAHTLAAVVDAGACLLEGTGKRELAIEEKYSLRKNRSPKSRCVTAGSS
ncbi:hypothetical protein quinque_014041 [Culex quinquefasciatus]